MWIVVVRTKSLDFEGSKVIKMENKESFIKLDENGICINGKYRILLASSLFYFRIPKEKWQERMRILKLAGYQAIDVYFPWNYHETEPDQWDFEGNRDVTRFLELAAENDLFVIARPGPYICSEWDGGAIPAWLWAEGVKVRQDDAAFLEQLGNWYAHILPIIEPFQIGQGGTVICMQIENELDFYDCKSPVSYMQKLKKTVERMGIYVPCFYCCGQNDLLRAGGLTPGLYTAFNVYAEAGCAGLEARALHLYESVRERNMPFLITETNREHSFLKRLLACGAKLISPYNQTAGCTMEWYNGITNWGDGENPIALMASDYDFTSMIGSAGEVNPEFYEARLLAGLIGSMGEELAQAVPEIADGICVYTKGKRNSVIPVLKTERGFLAEISNLGMEDTVRIQDGEETVNAVLKAAVTCLLPWRFRLDQEGRVLLWLCSYELAWFEEKEGQLRVGLYGNGTLEAVLEIEGTIHHISQAPVPGVNEWTAPGVSLLFGTKESMAACVPGLAEPARLLEEQSKEYRIDKCWASACSFATVLEKKALVQPMEKLGQYHGIGCYEVELPKQNGLLFKGAADIITVEKENRVIQVFYGDGSCREMKLEAGKYRIYTEIWGHSNFDDIRQESLRMGSLKGMEKIVAVDDGEDISENWLFDLDEQPIGEWCFFRHSPMNTILSIDGYNRACSPVETMYDKWVALPQEADSIFLSFSKADCLIYVYVNGHLEQMVQKSNPYVDLSAYAGNDSIEICLRVRRRYYTDSVGQVILLTGRQIRECRYGAVPVEAVKAYGETKEICLPLHMKQGGLLLLRPDLSGHEGRDVKLFFKGKAVKLTVLGKEQVIGRVLLETKDFPVVRGGCSNVIFLCREWLEEGIRIIAQAVGDQACLEEISMKAYWSVLEEG